MSDPAVAAPRLSATLVSQFFRFRCERQFRFAVVPESLRGGEVPARNANPERGPLVGPRPGTELLRREGRRWERQALRRLVARAGTSPVEVVWGERGGAEPLHWGRVREALRNSAPCLLVQPEIRLTEPEVFARRYGIRSPELIPAAARPDVLRIRGRGDGGLVVDVLDVKAGARSTAAHRAQVAFYALLLEEAARQEGILLHAEEQRGWIWARGGGRPRPFPLPAYRHHVERFLGIDVPRILATPVAECAWNVGASCTGCAFVDHCRAEAERADDLSRVVGMTPLAREVLRSRGIGTVAQLARNARRDTLQGCHSLEAGGTRLQKQAQSILWNKALDLDAYTHHLPVREDVRILLSAEGDPVSGRCFALGFKVVDGRRDDEAVYLAGERGGEAEVVMVAQWLAQLDSELSRAESASVHLYLWDRTELDLLHRLVLRHLEQAEIQPYLGRLLRAAVGRRGQPDTEALRSSFGTVLADAVSALFALPVAFSYDLASVSARLEPDHSGWVHCPRPEYALPFSSQIAFERIHNVWSRRALRTAAGEEPVEEVVAEIRRTVLSKLRAADSVLRAVRERASRDARRRGISRLQLRKEPLVFGDGDAPLADPLLERLRVFATMEAVHEAMAVRQLHLLPAEQRARRFECIRGLNLVDRQPGGRLVFEFDPECRDAKFRVGDFNLILTNDDGRSLVEMDRRPWDRARLQVELVDLDASHEPPRLTLVTRSGFARAEADGLVDLERVCVLDRAGSDVNTRRVLATLRALADGAGPTATVSALLRGESRRRWSPPLGAGAAAEIADALLAPLALRRGEPVLNPEQQGAWNGALEQPITLVWGPPGTGKTYLLAWTLLGMVEGFRRRGRPCRILVTAATHRAVVNVLVRLARELEGAGIVTPPRLVKMRGSGNEADRDLDGLPVDLVEDARLPALLHSAGLGAPVIVGSTVWSLWKQMRAAARAEASEGADAAPIRSWFDVVVVDEASQIKVPEALIAVSSLLPDGQLILCGDHRQLAPVIHGRYADAGDTLYGSVFAYAAAHHTPFSLRQSRRMNEVLVEYPRTHFYPGLVSVSPGQRIAVAGVGEPADAEDDLLAEFFLAPEDAVVLCTYTGVRAAARNPFEANLIARLVRLARKLLLDPATGMPFTDARFASHGLAVIAPHRAQNSAILTALRALSVPGSAMPVVDTVERMQGNEREVVFVSYGVADREYAEAEAEFLLDPHRFNVSITRARSKLVLFLSEEVLAAVPRDEEVLAGAMMIHGYPAHCVDGVREVELPGPAGERVRAKLHYRKLAAPSAGAPQSAGPDVARPNGSIPHRCAWS